MIWHLLLWNKGDCRSNFKTVMTSSHHLSGCLVQFKSGLRTSEDKDKSVVSIQRDTHPLKSEITSKTLPCAVIHLRVPTVSLMFSLIVKGWAGRSYSWLSIKTRYELQLHTAGGCNVYNDQSRGYNDDSTHNTLEYYVTQHIIKQPHTLKCNKRTNTTAAMFTFVRGWFSHWLARGVHHKYYAFVCLCVFQVVKPLAVICSSPSSSSSSPSSPSSHVPAAAHLPPATHTQTRSGTHKHTHRHTHTSKCYIDVVVSVLVAMAIPAASPWLVNELGEALCTVVAPPPYSYDPNGSDLPRGQRSSRWRSTYRVHTSAACLRLVMWWKHVHLQPLTVCWLSWPVWCQWEAGLVTDVGGHSVLWLVNNTNMSWKETHFSVGMSLKSEHDIMTCCRVLSHIGVCVCVCVCVCARVCAYARVCV